MSVGAGLFFTPPVARGRHDQTRLPAGTELPADRCCALPSARIRPPVNAQQMAPGTHRCDVVIVVAAACGAELEVVRRDVSARAHRARAAVAIADVDVAVGDVWFSRWRQALHSERQQKRSQLMPDGSQRRAWFSRLRHQPVRLTRYS